MENQNMPVKLRQVLSDRLSSYIAAHGIKSALRQTCKAGGLLAAALLLSNPPVFNTLLVWLIKIGNGFLPAVGIVYLSYRYRSSIRSAFSTVSRPAARPVSALSAFLLSQKNLTINAVMSGLKMSFRQAGKLLKKLEEIRVLEKDPEQGNARVLSADLSPERLSEIVDGKTVEEMTAVNIVSYIPSQPSPFKIRSIGKTA